MRGASDTVFIRRAVICCLVMELLNCNHCTANKGPSHTAEALCCKQYLLHKWESERQKEYFLLCDMHTQTNDPFLTNGSISDRNGFSAVVSHLAKEGFK